MYVISHALSNSPQTFIASFYVTLYNQVVILPKNIWIDKKVVDSFNQSVVILIINWLSPIIVVCYQTRRNPEQQKEPLRDL